ncbi:UNVERIFIED_ORG: hypothetical protein J2791_000988 [Burkholderia contaminans]|nr:hypothetical protein [Burkholderia contaminans]
MVFMAMQSISTFCLIAEDDMASSLYEVRVESQKLR